MTGDGYTTTEWDTGNLTMDALLSAVKLIKSAPPKRYEIWLSSSLPKEDGEGNKIDFIEIAVQRDPFTIFPYLKETTHIIFMHPDIFKEIGEEAFAHGVPVFMPGGKRVEL